jgi:hypothetical protein
MEAHASLLRLVAVRRFRHTTASIATSTLTELFSLPLRATSASAGARLEADPIASLLSTAAPSNPSILLALSPAIS